MSYPVKKHGEIISQDTRSLISKRYKTVTKAVNQTFWNSSSEISNSLYVGSYGRGTAVDESDIDILVELPKSEYERYDVYTGNGQSRLLQALKSALQTPCPRSNIKADGQVVKIDFNDGMKFEVLPTFRNTNWWGDWDGTYSYPDTNMGGTGYRPTRKQSNRLCVRKTIAVTAMGYCSIPVSTCAEFAMTITAVTNYPALSLTVSCMWQWAAGLG
jgi:predicted nucleotidyltransferase